MSFKRWTRSDKSRRSEQVVGSSARASRVLNGSRPCLIRGVVS